MLEIYNKIWDKVSNSIKKGFDGEPVYNEKYLKAKTKSYDGKVNKNLHSDKIPKDGSHFNRLSVILIESAFRTGKNYYRQGFC